MFSKRNCVIIAVAGYLALIISFVFTHNKTVVEQPCFDKCKEKNVFRNVFECFFVVSSVLLTIATILIQNFIRKLNATLSVKVEFCLVISLMFMFVAASLMNLDSLLPVKLPFCLKLVGFLCSVLWMTVSQFDIWWTTRKDKTSADDSLRLKIYWFYVVGVFGGLCIVLFLWLGNVIPYSPTMMNLYALVLSNLIFLIIFFVLSAINLFRLSKTENSSDQSWFEMQKSRFWMNVQLFLILAMVCSVRNYSALALNDSPFSDEINCYSAFLVFIIFATRKIFLDSYCSNVSLEAVSKEKSVSIDETLENVVT